jgi:coenzyme Q-binding protein COQ10
LSLATPESRSVTICRRTLHLPYRGEDVFDLISDVRRYPDFVRWLRRLRVISEQTREDGWTGRAETTVGFGGFSETFTTDIAAKRSSMTVDVALVRGPLRRLTNRWRITPTPTGSTVDFHIDFEFRNFLLQALAESNRDFAVQRLIECFLEEAERRFGSAKRLVDQRPDASV